MNGKWNAWRLSPKVVSHNLSGFLSAAAFITPKNQILATTAHQQKDDSNETVWVGIPIAFVFAPGGGPWKAKVKIARAAECLSSFNMCEAKDVPQNGMSHQMHSASVCMNLCYLEPDTCPFPGEEKKQRLMLWIGCKWANTERKKGWKHRWRVINTELCSAWRLPPHSLARLPPT